MKSFEIQKYDKLKKLLIDIQNNKINPKITYIDNYIFFFGKIFNFKNKKQKYLQKLEIMIQEELSIDNLFLEFKKMQRTAFREMNFTNVSNINNNDIEKKVLIPTKSTKGHCSHASSLSFK